MDTIVVRPEVEVSSPVTLTLTIDNSQPVELDAFVRAFTSLAKEYRSVARERLTSEADAQIYVQQVRTGSIVAELVPVVATVFPIIAQTDKIIVAVEFVERWRDRITSLASGVVPEGFSKSDLATFSGAVEAIAKDPDASSRLEAATFEDGKREIRAAFKFTTNEALGAERTIEAEYKRLSAETDDTFERVLMVFTRPDIGDAPTDKRSGERVIIADISEKSLPIIYASELAERRVKHVIREADDNVFKKGFNVDVSVQRRGDRVLAYRILAVHEVIDLPDE